MRISRSHKLGVREQLANISLSRQGSLRRDSLRARRRGWAALCAVLVVSLASAGLSVSPVSAQDADGPSARVWARKLASGNVEFGVAVYAAGSSSGTNVAVTNRYFPYEGAASNIGTWYNSEAVILESGSDRTLASIRARRLMSGNLEFALRVYGIEDRVWIPRARYFVYESANQGTAAYSSPFNFKSHHRACLNGGVTNAARNLNLFRDCEVLTSATGPLQGTTTILSQLNSWGTRQGSVPQLPWTGITLKSNRVTDLYIGSGQAWCPGKNAWDQGSKGSHPGADCALSETVRFVYRMNSSSENDRLYGIFDDYGPLRNLEGRIPEVIGSLRALERLWIEGTGTQGIIPPELGNLTNLKDLRFNEIGLVGGIPPELGELSNLEILRLNDLKWTEVGYRCRNNPTECGLPDPIPPEVLSLMESTSGLPGGIPAELGKLTNLKHLSIANTLLKRSIPSELGDLANLEFLDLVHNHITGEIPAELGKLTNLTHLKLNANRLTGQIPAELGDLENLQYLALGWNNLSGPIPTELGKLATDGKIKRISFVGTAASSNQLHFGEEFPNYTPQRGNNRDLGCIPAALNKTGIQVDRSGRVNVGTLTNPVWENFTLEFCTS